MIIYMIPLWILLEIILIDDLKQSQKLITAHESGVKIRLQKILKYNNVGLRVLEKTIDQIERMMRGMGK
ncbi:hypothetical protein [Bacillus sp. BP-3]|uniref:hypothetical protein n=1 Tax=Bacillus sp. BP-3 TaxID=3022773 RepID=UPI00232D3228|nr:hypothetical protein [Bacillus sp. BP-3]